MIKTKINVKLVTGGRASVELFSNVPDEVANYFNRLNVKRRLLRKPKTHFSK